MAYRSMSRKNLIATGQVRVVKEPGRKYADDRKLGSWGLIPPSVAKLHRSLLDLDTPPYWLKPVKPIVPELAQPKRDRKPKRETPLGLVKHKSVWEMTPAEQRRELDRQIARLKGWPHDNDDVVQAA